MSTVGHRGTASDFRIFLSFGCEHSFLHHRSLPSLAAVTRRCQPRAQVLLLRVTRDYTSPQHDSHLQLQLVTVTSCCSSVHGVHVCEHSCPVADTHGLLVALRGTTWASRDTPQEERAFAHRHDVGQ